jgi:cobalt/nickel transport system permease protein
MPEWLLKEDKYIPLKDQDGFIDKSILSIINLLGLIGKTSPNKNGKISAELKVIFTLIDIILIITSKYLSFTLIFITYELVYLSLIDGKTMVKILKGTFIGGLFTLLIMLPSILLGNVNGEILVIKVAAVIALVNILSHTEELYSIIAALKVFKIPDIFIFILDTSIKYIFILGEFSLNMLYALKKRSIGKLKNKYTSLSGIIGNLFLKSGEYSKDMYYAMELRGFDGTYLKSNKKRLGKNDFIYIIVNVIIIISYIYMIRL